MLSFMSISTKPVVEKALASMDALEACSALERMVPVTARRSPMPMFANLRVRLTYSVSEPATVTGPHPLLPPYSLNAPLLRQPSG